MTGNTRVDRYAATGTFKAQDCFDAQTIHPTSRSCIPCPPAPSGMRRNTIHIGGDNIRFDLILVHFLVGITVQDRVKQPEKFYRLVAVSQLGKSPGSPYCCMSVLTAIFSNTRW